MPKHDFTMVPYSEKLTYKDVELKDAVSVDDALILYLLDSLQWVESSWNDISKKNIGINYYGVTFFVGEEITHLKSILDSWVSLFKNAPNEFTMQKAIYPEEPFFKETILKELLSVIKLCDVASKGNSVLVHYGI